MFEKGVKLSRFSSFKIGGEAKYFADIKTVDEAVAVLNKWHNFSSREKGAANKIFILGGGTNILWSDEGFDGLVLHQNIRNLEVNDNETIVGGGILVSELLEFLIEKGISGLEWAGGLPGTVGGAVCDNAGAFKGEMKDSIVEVLSLDMESGKLVRRSNSECGFGYRKSIFKVLPSQEIILEVRLRLGRGNAKTIEESILEKIRYRENRHPLEYPNIGSIFKNVAVADYPQLTEPPFASHIKIDPFPVIPSAFLISEAGLKGVSCGGAMVSVKHSNFIVNVLSAAAKDVKALVELVKSEVSSKFKIKLQEEVIIYP